jgi:pimeloyl-ACP methyl ester carboxylesterase
VGLHLERGGAGPKLVLVHGLGGSSFVWSPVRERLERERDVLLVDLPGFGRSDELADGIPPTAANLAAAVTQACREHGVERPHVAGNSLGAWVALEMAKVGAAASVCGISPAGLWRAPIGLRRYERHRLGRRIRPLLRLMMRSSRGRALLLRTTLAHPERVASDEARRLVLAYLDSPGYALTNDEMRAGAFEPEQLVNVPVTIAWGEADRIARPPSRSRMPPGTRFLTVPGWGHTPTWDDPDGVAALILDASKDGEGTTGDRVAGPSRTPGSRQEADMGFMDKVKGTASQATDAAKAGGQAMREGMSSDTAATAAKMQKLSQSGVEQKAILQSMTATGKTAVGGGIEHTLVVEVQPVGGAAYTATFNQDLIQASVDAFQQKVGQEITVKVDPDDPQSMVAWG